MTLKKHCGRLRLAEGGQGGPQVGALIETAGPPCPSYACLTLGGRMSKTTAILGSAMFFFVAPAMLAGVIPWLITHWEFWPPKRHAWLGSRSLLPACLDC